MNELDSLQPFVVTVKTRDFTLTPWQSDAVRSWIAGDGERPFHGTLEIFTGGGKTLIALECCAQAAHHSPNLKLAVVVPTEALAHQWRTFISRYTSIADSEIGLLGAGGEDTFQTHRALVCVLNTAAQELPAIAVTAQPLMLVVDECHRAGAPSFSKVLTTPAAFRLGLSATPDRDEVDEQGEPIGYDAQLVGSNLGRLVYQFSLRDARNKGWLPDYEIHHHGVQLNAGERRRYDEESNRIDDLSQRLVDIGIDPTRARKTVSTGGETGKLAAAYVAATANRKSLLYRASERSRVVETMGEAILNRKPRARILLFHERVDEAVDLHRRLTAALPGVSVGLEHSRLADAERSRAIRGFREGDVQILVSVKSLIEGIDVPDADVGISVASSASVRQRIQSLGRVLRRTFDSPAETKKAEMHLVYVSNTVDETIYGKEDWSDLTGPGRNLYWVWPDDPKLPAMPMAGPPRTPLPTEEQEWERIGIEGLGYPTPWKGAIPALEYSVDSRGSVTTVTGAVVSNPQGVDKMVMSVRSRPGGRFYVTPVHKFVIVRGEGRNAELFAVGQLSDPVSVNPNGDSVSEPFDVEALRAGSPYPGPAEKARGTFSLRLKRGGVIARQGRQRVTEFALVEGGGDSLKEENARRVLQAWKTVSKAGLTFFINEEWDAWYLEASQPRFLARVTGGFAWPSDAVARMDP